MNEEPEVNNFLDDYTDPLTGVTYGKGDDKDIIKRIIETYQSSTIYGFLHNNCEHIATYVRYGVRVAVQVRNRLHLFFEHLMFRSANKEEGTMTQIKKMTNFLSVIKTDCLTKYLLTKHRLNTPTNSKSILFSHLSAVQRLILTCISSAICWLSYRFIYL